MPIKSADDQYKTQSTCTLLTISRPRYLEKIGKGETSRNHRSMDDAISLQLTHIFNNALIQVRPSWVWCFLLGTEQDINCIRMIEIHQRYRPITNHISY